MTDLHDAVLHGDEKIDTPFGTVELQNTLITDASSEVLFDQFDLQRAAQAYVWALPMVGFTAWRDHSKTAFGWEHPSDFVVYKTLREKRGIVTANLTTPYIISFFNLSDGPLSLDYPAGMTAGAVIDFWQRPVADVGLTGPDQGKGGRYVVIGPEDDASAFDSSDALVIQSATVNGFLGLRLLNDDPAFAEQFKKDLKLTQGDQAHPVRFIEGLDVEWDGTPPRGIAFWTMLNAVLQQEPVREVDKAMMALLEPLGIVKGQTFEPDDRQKRILTKGAALGELFARNLQMNPRYSTPYWSGTSWHKCFDFRAEQETDSILQIDQRVVWFYEAVTSTKGMVQPTPGTGQVYMTSKRDSEGRLLRADKTYRLHVPAGVPVEQFWSLTLYSENTRRPYDNGGTEARSTSLDSRDKQLSYNDDGSIDLYIGPKAPDGAENNWMKTIAPDGWFTYFRLYAPSQPFFDKTWSLPDFEEL